MDSLVAQFGEEIIELDGTVQFVLNDGSEIHRIEPPTEVYDYQTGKLVGYIGPRGRRVRLAADSAVEAPPSKAGEVEILDY